jgi:LysM repeat protein
LLVSACNLAEQPTAVVLIRPTTSDNATGTPTPFPLTDTPVPSNTPVPNQPTANQPVTTGCNPPSDWVTYTVQRGDTLFSIAQRANTTVDALSAANCITDPSSISTGQRLYVPNDIRSDDSMVYWVQTETRNADSLVVACESYVTPTESALPRVSDAATNIRNSLNLLFSSNQGVYNHWAGQGLSVQSVNIDSNGRANIVVTGDLTLVGTCADGVMKAQFLLSVFAEASVQSSYVTVGGQNLVQVFDMSGLQPATAVFTRADIPIVQ